MGAADEGGKGRRDEPSKAHLFRLFKRRLVTNVRFSPKDCGMLQLAMLTIDKDGPRPCTLTDKHQAEQLSVGRDNKVSLWTVGKIRRVAVGSGLFKQTAEGLERTDIADGDSMAWFTACKRVGLALRVTVALTDMASGTKDGWARISEAELAKLTGAYVDSVSRVLGRLGDLFEIKTVDKRHRYRPRLELVGDVSNARKAALTNKPRSVRAILELELGLPPTVIDGFSRDHLHPAMRLGITQDEMAMTEALGKMFAAIGDARKALWPTLGRDFVVFNMPDAGTLLTDYVDWLLAERQGFWRGHSLRTVMCVDGTAFRQFIHDRLRRGVDTYHALTGEMMDYS